MAKVKNRASGTVVEVSDERAAELLRRGNYEAADEKVEETKTEAPNTVPAPPSE